MKVDTCYGCAIPMPEDDWAVNQLIFIAFI